MPDRPPALEVAETVYRMCRRCGASEELSRGLCWECCGAAGPRSRAAKPLVMALLAVFGHQRDLFSRLQPQERTDRAYARGVSNVIRLDDRRRSK